MPLIHCNWDENIFAHRGIAVCSTVPEAVDFLSSDNSRQYSNAVVKGDEPDVVFMFPGLGAQYENMGRELYEKEPLFRKEMDRCFEFLKTRMGVDLKEILYPASSAPPTPENSASLDINRFEVSQLGIFTVEYALASLLVHWGIKPRAMIGYSFGEFTAACIAGVFSPEDALKLIVMRGRLIQELPDGAMVSVPLPREELTPLLPPDISLAIDNGSSCIAAGTPQSR